MLDWHFSFDVERIFLFEVVFIRFLPTFLKSLKQINQIDLNKESQIEVRMHPRINHHHATVRDEFNQIKVKEDLTVQMMLAHLTIHGLMNLVVLSYRMGKSLLRHHLKEKYTLNIKRKMPIQHSNSLWIKLLILTMYHQS
jgi:hypothetical protein